MNKAFLEYRYEWVDVGMLDYDPATKLYQVKRVCVPDHILERNIARKKEREEREREEVGNIKIQH